MRILKEYETKINLNAESLYGGILSDENYILNFLKQNFENRCMDSSFITNILNIKHRSMIPIDKDNLEGGGSICVVFRAESLVYAPNSILCGCKVTNIEHDGKILCEYDNATIHVRGNRNFAPLKDDLIIVQVVRIGYPNGSVRMNIAALPYFIQPTFHSRLSKVEQPNSDDIDLLKRKLKEITDVEAIYKKLDTKIVKFFNDLFYPFKDPSMYAKPSFDQYNIIELAESCISGSKSPIKHGSLFLFSRHSALHKQLPTAFGISADLIKTLPRDNFTDRDKLDIKMSSATYARSLLEMLDDYCSYLQLIIKCCDTYNTEQIRKKHQKLWTVYENIKI